MARKIPFISNDWISIRMLAPLIILFSFYQLGCLKQFSLNKKSITILFISIIIFQIYYLIEINYITFLNIRRW